MEDIRARLFAMADEPYGDFTARLIPTADRSRFIGVRTPALRALAKELSGKPETEAFLAALPHEYHDENQLHAMLISGEKNYRRALDGVNAFLPWVDNWATCDQLSPRAFKKHRAELLPEVSRWISSGETYTVRFAVGMLMAHFLDEDFRPEYLAMAAGVQSREYYVNMMRAWYFATALAKQYDAAEAYLRDGGLDEWTHNKTIQKAVESYRISEARKEYLKTLRR